eukprot:1150346-Pelagomonas_calceolata.AAC.2
MGPGCLVAAYLPEPVNLEPPGDKHKFYELYISTRITQPLLRRLNQLKQSSSSLSTALAPCSPRRIDTRARTHAGAVVLVSHRQRSGFQLRDPRLLQLSCHVGGKHASGPVSATDLGAKVPRCQGTALGDISGDGAGMRQPERGRLDCPPCPSVGHSMPFAVVRCAGVHHLRGSRGGLHAALPELPKVHPRSM